MKKSYRIGVVLLSAALAVIWASGEPAFGQRFRINTGGSNQGNTKKDKDKDDQNNNGNSGNNNNNSGGQGSNNNSNNNQGGKNGDQNNQGNNQNNNNNSGNNNQGNQGAGQNNSNAGGSNKSGNSGKESTEDKIKQYLQNKVNQGQGQGGNRNQFPGQGNSNGRDFGNRGNNNNNDNNFNNGGFKVNPGNAQSRNKWDDDDWDNNKNRIKIGAWNGNSWQGSRKVDNWNKAYGGNQKLFSKQWYDDHPRAWNWDNHNHNNKSNVWVVASIPGVYQWLGWGSVPQEYRAYYNPNNVPRFDPNDYGDWYPLGVYSLMTGPDDLGSRVVQLAVDRHGHLNGTYYDMITDNSFQVSGDIQQQTQRAFWSLNSNPNVQFSASVFRLLQPDGTISVRLPGGDQRWQFVRLEN